jgi:hypothetical protein
LIWRVGLHYRARNSDCDTYGLKAKCTPKEPLRKVLRSIYEPSRDVARNIVKTTQYAVYRKLRKKVEMLFAHLKRILGLSHIRLRGPTGVIPLSLYSGKFGRIQRQIKSVLENEMCSATIQALNNSIWGISVRRHLNLSGDNIVVCGM